MGAGSVVTKDVPDYALVYGNATRIAGWMCECGERIGFGSDCLSDVDGDAECTKCVKQYVKNGLVVRRWEVITEIPGRSVNPVHGEV